MSTCLQTVNIDGETKAINSDIIVCKYNNNNSNRCSLKCKENIYNFKYNKALKRKLKKYKLRKDGKEDDDILDVSQSLLSSLKIKSPDGKQNINSFSERGDFIPKNYLTKMARRIQSNKISNTSKNCNIIRNPSKERGITKSLCAAALNEITEDDSVLTPKSEEKKQNAFKLMMDSRNHSIGNNSSGKVKFVDESELQEIVEKKNVKAKRKLLLQKMAEAKGSLKKKEMEEYQEELIKQTMAKRAETLKGMLTTNHSKSSKPNKKNDNLEEKLISVSPDNSDKSSFSEARSLQLINIFDDSNKSPSNKINPEKSISKENKEFLEKLSPSIKKKENMLCYFKKIEKDPEPYQDVDNNTQIIKVKLTPRNKKKAKKKKLSLNRNKQNSSTKNEDNSKLLDKKQELENVESTSEGVTSTKNNERKKTKRKENAEFIHSNIDSTQLYEKEQVRPRRNVKRPIKYADEIELSSSHEDLHIFTPKKKKHVEDEGNSKKIASAPNEVSNTTSISKEIKLLQPKKKKAKKEFQKESTKLAPIFMKQQLDSVSIEAKQKFLQSGIPDQLKKIIAQQKDRSTVLINFPIVVHVQQNKAINVSKSTQTFMTSDSDTDEEICVKNGDGIFKSILTHKIMENTGIQIPLPKKNTDMILHNIKQSYPEFPVYRTYRLLKDRTKGDCKDYSHINMDNSIEVINGIIDIKNEDPDTLNWMDKYKAMSTNQIIGNFESIKEMKKWLIAWTENEVRSKNDANSGSDSSDFYQSDSKDSTKSTNNFLILTGPTGSGKTSSVYAVASELAIKVIEVNASSKRTGKIMLQDLQEATQSHKVNRRKGNSTENSQKSQEIVDCDAPRDIKKRGRPKKFKETTLKKMSGSSTKIEELSQTSSQESFRTAMSLILIDDADIVFDQDDGFCSAVAQLINYSKRPVILITASLACTHLQKFIQSGKILNMSRFLPRMLGTWLDIMCLADNGICWPGMGANFLNFHEGDIRKTINSLQFYMLSYSQQATLVQEGATKNSDDYKSIIDESSSMSWTHKECENNVTTMINSSAEDIWKCFMGQQTQLLHATYSSKLFNTWWSLPKVLYESSTKTECVIDDSDKKQNHLMELEAIASTIDDISISDYLSNIRPDAKYNFISKPWYCSERDSVCENENLSSYNRNLEVIDEISFTLVKRSIIEAQKKTEMQSNINVNFPDMTLQRKRDKVVLKHHNLTSYLNPSAVLDRRALALDYWSSCRTICRIEKVKTDSNIKRNNRFCHYLKSVKVMCKNDSFNRLCDSLCCSGIRE